MTEECLFAYAMKLVGYDPLLIYEPQSGNSGNRIPVSNDKLVLQKYVSENLGDLLDKMYARCGTPIEWRHALDHHSLVDVTPLVKAGILREENLKRI